MRWIAYLIMMAVIIVAAGYAYLYASAKTPEMWFRQQCMADAHNRAEWKRREDISKFGEALREEEERFAECQDRAHNAADSYLSSLSDETRIAKMVSACEPKYLHQVLSAIKNGVSASIEQAAVASVCREDATEAIWYFDHPVQYRVAEIRKCNFNANGYDYIDCRQTPGDFAGSEARTDFRVFDRVSVEIRNLR
jgi:hypothetical protein